MFASPNTLFKNEETSSERKSQEFRFEGVKKSPMLSLTSRILREKKSEREK